MTCGEVEAAVVEALKRYADGIYSRGTTLYTDASAELRVGGLRYLAAVRGISVADAEGGVRVIADFLLIRDFALVFSCRLVLRRGAYRHRCEGEECPREVVEEGLRRLGL